MLSYLNKFEIKNKDEDNDIYFFSLNDCISEFFYGSSQKYPVILILGYHKKGSYSYSYYKHIANPQCSSVVDKLEPVYYIEEVCAQSLVIKIYLRMNQY